MTDPNDHVRRSVEAVSTKTGLTTDAVAILFIIAGILVLVLPFLIQWILGILLIVAGVLFLVQSRQARTASPPGP